MIEAKELTDFFAGMARTWVRCSILAVLAAFFLGAIGASLLIAWRSAG